LWETATYSHKPGQTTAIVLLFTDHNRTTQHLAGKQQRGQHP